MSDRPDTRAQMLATAAQLFAGRGYHGASLANIADSLGLTKQALIHHFRTKDALYAEVMARAAAPFLAAAVPGPGDNGADARLEAAAARLCAHARSNPDATRLLLRELMDSRLDGDGAGGLYLGPLLGALVAMVQDTPRWQEAPEPQAQALACQLLGAIFHFVVSEPALTRLYGAAQMAETGDIFPGELRRTVRALTGASGPGR